MTINIPAFLNTVSSSLRSLPIIILYVTEECNLRCITCSYRKALPGELTLDEIRGLAGQLHAFGLRRIAYSGGEPLMRRDFPAICEIFRRYGVKQTLLTNGLLLGRRFKDIAGFFSEIVVSVDGADASTHDSIRGCTAFDRILDGVRIAAARPRNHHISLRTVVQKTNFRQIPAIVDMAHALDVDHVSFLAPDMTSDAFGRTGSTTGQGIMLDAEETRELQGIIKGMTATHREDFARKFIVQPPGSLSIMASNFEAALGLRPYAPARCNAPMVSAVITSTGVVKPCFFLAGQGNVRTTPVRKIVNAPTARSTRGAVRAGTPHECRTCVCTLHSSPIAALLDRF